MHDLWIRYGIEVDDGQRLILPAARVYLLTPAAVNGYQIPPFPVRPSSVRGAHKIHRERSDRREAVGSVENELAGRRNDAALGPWAGLFIIGLGPETKPYSSKSRSETN